MVIMLASFAFAQITPQEVKTTQMKFGNFHPLPKKSNYSYRSNTESFWFSFRDAFEAYWGDFLNYGGIPMLQDANGAVKYYNGYYSPQFYSW